MSKMCSKDGGNWDGTKTSTSEGPKLPDSVCNPLAPPGALYRRNLKSEAFAFASASVQLHTSVLFLPQQKSLQKQHVLEGILP